MRQSNNSIVATQDLTLRPALLVELGKSDTRALREALELFLESASPTEIKQPLRDEVFVTQIEVAIG